MEGALPVRGWDPSAGCSIDAIMQAALSTGCQASTLGQAVQEVNRMVSHVHRIAAGSAARRPERRACA